jgi:hypothetical protein
VLWLVVDLALALLVLVALGACLVRLWRRVRALGRSVGAASASVAPATDALAAAQASRSARGA